MEDKKETPAAGGPGPGQGQKVDVENEAMTGKYQETGGKSRITDNYAKIPNGLIDRLMQFRIPGEQMQVLMVIIRKTYGWEKRSDWIALNQFVEFTGISKRNVLRAIQALEERKIVIVVKNDNKKHPSYRINEKFNQWKVLSKKTPLSKLTITGVKNDNAPLSNSPPTIDTPTKDTDTKDNDESGRREKSSKKNNQSTDGLSEAQQEYIDLRVEQAAARGEIKKSKAGYKAKLVSLAKAGDLDISDLESLRANFGDDWMPPMPQDDMPENHLEWTTSSHEPWDLLGIDRETFTRDLEAGKIQFNSADKSYGRDIGDSIHAAWPDGTVEHLPIPDSARSKYEGLETVLNTDTGAVMSPKQKHNARVLQKVRNDLFGNAGRD